MTIAVGNIETQGFPAMLEAANACPCIGEATAHIIIPNPSPNVDAVLPIHFIPESEAFRVM